MSFNLNTTSAIPKVKVIAKIQGQILYFWQFVASPIFGWLLLNNQKVKVFKLLGKLKEHFTIKMWEFKKELIIRTQFFL